MTDLAVVSPDSTYTALSTIADRVARTAMVPKGLRGKPDEVLAVILTGRELGLPPMASMQLIDFIDGNPTLNAQGCRALITGAGHDLWAEVNDEKRCLLHARRKGSDVTHTVEWTIERARAANLTGKGVWKQYPANMLLNRASTEMARNYFADLLMGVSYDPEELGFDEGPAYTPIDQQTPTMLSDRQVDGFREKTSDLDWLQVCGAVGRATDGRTTDVTSVYQSELQRLRDEVQHIRAKNNVEEAQLIDPETGEILTGAPVDTEDLSAFSDEPM